MIQNLFNAGKSYTYAFAWVLFIGSVISGSIGLFAILHSTSTTIFFTLYMFELGMLGLQLFFLLAETFLFMKEIVIETSTLRPKFR